jgi:hypothetical protein
MVIYASRSPACIGSVTLRCEQSETAEGKFGARRQRPRMTI